MLCVEAIPGSVVLAAARGVFNPLEPPDRNDMTALRKVRSRLFCVCPIRVEQQPCRRLSLEMQNHLVQDFASPRRVGYDCIALGKADRKRVRPVCQIAFVDALQSYPFKLGNESSFTAARLGKRTYPGQMRSELFHSTRVYRLVGVHWPALEV